MYYCVFNIWVAIVSIDPQAHPGKLFWEGGGGAHKATAIYIITAGNFLENTFWSPSHHNQFCNACVDHAQQISSI